MQTSNIVALALPLLVAAVPARTQDAPVGLWRAIDRKTGQPRSRVSMAEAAGVSTGRIEQRRSPQAKPGDEGDRCTDERKGRPLLGPAIESRVRRSAVDADVWDGGDMTDPAGGKVCRGRLKPAHGGRLLEVPGHIGPFFRKQTWLWVE